jgi:N-acetylneuraminic acid mutarotase
MGMFFTIQSVMASLLSLKTYIFGGSDGSSDLSDTDEYSTDVDSWISKINIPSPARSLLATARINSKIYLFGGTGNLTDTDEYSLYTWTTKASMPSPGRYGLAASVIGTKGYVFGGYNTSPLFDTDEYDPALNSWASKTNLLSPGRYLHTAASASGRGHVFGGNEGTQGDGGSVQHTDDYYEDTWTRRLDMPTVKRQQFAATTISGKIYIFGGTSTYLYPFSDIDEYTPINTWVSKTSLPYNIYGSAASTVGTKGYLFGGTGGSGPLFKETFEYVSDTYTTKTDMPLPERVSHAAA